MASKGANSGKKAKQNKMEVRAETSVSEAIGIWEKVVVISRAPMAFVLLLVVGLTVYGWELASNMTRIGMSIFIGVIVWETARLAWNEWRDPALGTYDGGVLKFYWISGRSVEVPVAQVRRVKVHENPYWQVRRIYPKWFELEIAGEPSKVIVPAFNLKPQAREVLERMSR